MNFPSPIHDYINYRIYLRDFLAYHKRQKSPHFTQKQILSKLGVASTGFLSNVMAGRKNLTAEHIQRLKQAMRLDMEEAQYFEIMVYFTQARTPEEKDEWYSRLSLLQKIRLKQLDPKHLTLFAMEEMVFLFELLQIRPGKYTPAELAKVLDPPSTVERVKEALVNLENMGLVIHDEQKGYSTTEAAITSGDELRSLHLTAFQKKCMILSTRALYEISSTERDLSVLTLGLSKDGFRMVQQEIRHFRKRLARISMQDTDQRKVYQMNFQLFPVTKEVRK
jgi:uncharacterized protein (TIGR02147 family)